VTLSCSRTNFISLLRRIMTNLGWLVTPHFMNENVDWGSGHSNIARTKG